MLKWDYFNGRRFRLRFRQKFRLNFPVIKKDLLVLMKHFFSDGWRNYCYARKTYYLMKMKALTTKNYFIVQMHIRTFRENLKRKGKQRGYLLRCQTKYLLRQSNEEVFYDD